MHLMEMVQNLIFPPLFLAGGETNGAVVLWLIVDVESGFNHLMDVASTGDTFKFSFQLLAL